MAALLSVLHVLSVKSVHCRFYAFVNPALNCVRQRGKQFGQRFYFFSGHGHEDEVRWVHTTFWEWTDTDSEPGILLRSKCVFYAAQPVMSAGRTTSPHSEGSDWYGIIVDDNEHVTRHVKPVQRAERAKSPSAQVHVCTGFYNGDRLAAENVIGNRRSANLSGLRKLPLLG
jgi:hypothetical protein